MQITELAEAYRIKLGLRPWKEFEFSQLKRWRDDPALTQEAKKIHSDEKRQCGKTTKGLLLAIAEAKIRSVPLVIYGASIEHTRVMYLRALDLIGKLGIDVKVEKGQRDRVVFTDADFPRR